jgi:phytoene dehydrogenase-like protein
MRCVSLPPCHRTDTGACASHALYRRPDWIDNWSELDRPAYEAKKEEVADAITARLERIFPGLKAGTMFRLASGGRKAGKPALLSLPRSFVCC